MSRSGDYHCMALSLADRSLKNGKVTREQPKYVCETGLATPYFSPWGVTIIERFVSVD